LIFSVQVSSIIERKEGYRPTSRFPSFRLSVGTTLDWKGDSVTNGNHVTKGTLGLADIIIIGEPLGRSHIYLYL
jgi:hypothetical protein